MKNKQSNAPIWFFLILILAGVGYYFFLKNKKIVEAPATIPKSLPATPVKKNEKPALMPEGVQGEFGEEAAFPVEKTSMPVSKILTVAGTYTYSEDPKSSMIGKVCFTPNQTSSTIGKLICFDNQDEVFAVLGIQKGFSDNEKSCTLSAPATIEVKNYSRLTGDVGGYDSATLLKVTSQEKQTVIACK